MVPKMIVWLLDFVRHGGEDIRVENWKEGLASYDALPESDKVWLAKVQDVFDEIDMGKLLSATSIHQ